MFAAAGARSAASYGGGGAALPNYGEALLNAQQEPPRPRSAAAHHARGKSTPADPGALDWDLRRSRRSSVSSSEGSVRYFASRQELEGADAEAPEMPKSVAFALLSPLPTSPLARALRALPVLRPDDPLLRHWTWVLLFVLSWTALVVPVQVCFLDEDVLVAGGFWFATERICDAIFGLDVLINLNTAVWADEATRTALEYGRSKIAARYFGSGNALLDVASCVPWELVAQGAMGAAVGAGAGGGAPHAHRFKAARLLRLFQLLRLQRVATSPQRLLARLRDALGVSYSAATLAQLLAACVLLSHWLACAFHLVTELQSGDCNWVHAYFNSTGPAGVFSCLPDPENPPPSVSSRYIAAMYWSCMT
jgi:hypothetical protein